MVGHIIRAARIAIKVVLEGGSNRVLNCSEAWTRSLWWRGWSWKYAYRRTVNSIAGVA